MTQDKHTPGPWAQAHRKGGDGSCRTQVFPSADPANTIATIHWHSVAMRNGFTTDRDANARLIAAAPDMLALLIELVDIEGPLPGTSEWGDKARAAIARATGAA